MATNQYEEAAQDAAARGDADEMLVALARSGLLEKLTEQIALQYQALDVDDARDVVADAADALFSRIGGGERKRYVMPYLYKTAHNMARDRARHRQSQVQFDESRHDRVSEERDEEYALAQATVHDTRRATQFAAVKRLIEQLPHNRPRQVIAFIFNGLELGGLHLSNAEVGHALGISATAAAMAKSRGFDSLIELAKAEGIIDVGFTLNDLKSVDDANALNSGKESNL